MHRIPHQRSASLTDYLIGQDVEGHWLAVETHGRGGGIFADQGAALRYAVAETGHRPRAVRVTAQRLRLL